MVRPEKPPKEPWLVSFSPWAMMGGCLLGAVLFVGLVYLWLQLLVGPAALKDAGIDATVGQLTLGLGGGLAGVVFVALGPALAFLLGRLLRNQPNQSVHVLVFALAGAVLGATVGAFFGPDLTMVLAPTMGVATGLARATMSRWARL